MKLLEIDLTSIIISYQVADDSYQTTGYLLPSAVVIKDRHEGRKDKARYDVVSSGFSIASA